MTVSGNSLAKTAAIVLIEGAALAVLGPFSMLAIAGVLMLYAYRNRKTVRDRLGNRRRTKIALTVATIIAVGVFAGEGWWHYIRPDAHQRQESKLDRTLELLGQIVDRLSVKSEAPTQPAPAPTSTAASAPSKPTDVPALPTPRVQLPPSSVTSKPQPSTATPPSPPPMPAPVTSSGVESHVSVPRAAPNVHLKPEDIVIVDERTVSVIDPKTGTLTLTAVW